MNQEKRRERERDRLIARGFDGLYCPLPWMECGCWADDLYPCGERPRECRPGHASADGTGIYGKVLTAQQLKAKRLA